MKLIVGLGNPGNVYAKSRHNIGFISIKALAKKYKLSLKRDKSTFSINAKGDLGGQNIILAKPLTFMNLSGVAVRDLIKKYKVSLDNLLVICDDLDLEFGRLKIKPSGSSGGHRGLESIIDLLGSGGFARLRVGIGRPPRQSVPKNAGKTNWRMDRDPAKYVLAPFGKKENIREVIDRVSDCCEVWLTKGITEAMNIFNVRRCDLLADTSLGPSLKCIGRPTPVGLGAIYRTSGWLPPPKCDLSHFGGVDSGK